MKVLNSVLTLAIIGIVGQNSIGLEKSNIVGMNTQSSYTERLEGRVELALQNRIKAGSLSIVREDILDASLPIGEGSNKILFKINSKAEITGLKCQGLTDFVKYEGWRFEINRTIDISEVLPKLKSKLSERLFNAFEKELVAQRTNFLNLRAKLGDYQPSLSNALKTSPLNLIRPLGVLDFHLCFADISEKTDLAEQDDVRFTVLVPTSIVYGLANSPVLLSEFGFSHQQLDKEKAADNKNSNSPAISSDN